MSRYIITGGCGFIGSHLTNRLLQEGHEPVVIDNLSSGSRTHVPHGVHVIECDVLDAEKYRPFLDTADACFHLAAMPSVRDGDNGLWEKHQSNLSGFVRLIDAVTSARGAAMPLIYASSAAVYGVQENRPLPETAAALPISAYGADKLGCESHARAASVRCGLNTIGLRLFNVYGPGQQDDGVVATFCQRLMSDSGITVFGDGNQTRDFVFIDDVVDALVAALGLPQPGAHVVNVCTGRPTSINALLQSMSEALDRAPAIEYRPQRPGEIHYSVGDPATLGHLLGAWAPTGLKAGIGATLAWYRER